MNRDLVGLLDVFEVGVEVGDVVSVILEEPDRLAFAGESGPAVVSRAHVAAAIGVRRAGSLHGIGPDGRIFMPESGTRDGIVVQARDVPEAGRQIHGGLAVGSIEGAVFRGMLVNAEGDVE